MKTILCSALALLLTACAGVPLDQALSDTAAWTGRVQQAAPRLATDAAARDALQAERRRLLKGELGEAVAVDLALRTSPSAQSLLAQGWALQSSTAETAGWPRVGLAFERATQGPEVALTRTLSIGLAELVTLPVRRAAADRTLQVQRLQLASDLLALHGAVRMQWARAVAAGQLVRYHEQVKEAAEAGDDLAARLQKAGNFSLLQRSREQAFLADAQAQLARARFNAAAEREGLVRLLGLSADEAAGVRWPERLPDLPKVARDRADVLRAAASERLDLAIAQAQWRAAAGQERTQWTGVIDAEFALKKESTGGGDHTNSREIALSIALPDTATLRRQGASAAALAAALRLEQAQAEASSSVRERHAAYLTAYELALHYRDAVVPLRKTITDEMLLRYNGMLSGVFDLLADARMQVGAVIGAIEAQRDFWIASAALDAAILGTPSAAASLQAATPAASETKAGH